MHRIGGLAVIVGVMGWGQVSHATPILYSDLATYSLSNTRHSDIQIDFEGLAAPGGFINYGTTGPILSGVAFTGGLNDNLFANDRDTYQVQFGSPYNLGTGDFFQSGDQLGVVPGPASLTVSLPEGMNGAAFDFGTFALSGSQISVALSNGDAFSVLGGDFPSAQFLGFRSSTPFSSFDITVTGGDRLDTLTIDNLTIDAVPEPSTLLLLGTGLAMVGIKRRRQAK